MSERHKFALILFVFAVAIYLVSESGLTANDTLFYGLIGILLALKILLILFKLRQESEYD